MLLIIPGIYIINQYLLNSFSKPYQLAFKNYIFRVLIKTTFVTIIFLSSCSKNRHPTVKIISPNNEQAFNAPDVVNISADLQDPNDALGAEFLLVTKVNSSNDTIINFRDDRFTGNTSTYHLLKNFVSEAHTRYKIVVTASGEGVTSDSVFVNTN